MPTIIRRFGALLLAVLVLFVPAEALSALALQGINSPAALTVATTQGTLTLPSGTQYIRIHPRTISAYLEIGCTDGAALGTHYETIAANTTEVRAVHMHIKQGETVCLAGSAGGTVEITPLYKGL